jgi:hypothetical protein
MTVCARTVCTSKATSGPHPDLPSGVAEGHGQRYCETCRRLINTAAREDHWWTESYDYIPFSDAMMVRRSRKPANIDPERGNALMAAIWKAWETNAALPRDAYDERDANLKAILADFDITGGEFQAWTYFITMNFRDPALIAEGYAYCDDEPLPAAEPGARLEMCWDPRRDHNYTGGGQMSVEDAVHIAPARDACDALAAAAGEDPFDRDDHRGFDWQSLDGSTVHGGNGWPNGMSRKTYLWRRVV